MLCPARGQTLSNVDILKGIIDEPSENERTSDIEKLVEDYKKSPDTRLRDKVKELLQKSVTTSWTIGQIDAITQVAGRLGEPEFIPILIQNLTKTGPNHLHFGLPRFREEYPYANALTYYPKDAPGALMEAIVKSHDSHFIEVAKETIVEMEVTWQLIDKYKTSDSFLPLTDFIATRLVEREFGPYTSLGEDITEEKDPIILLRLHRLQTAVDKIKQ